jgi:hypothetical protein
VEELHGLGRQELEKCSEGACVFWCFPAVRKKAEKERKKKKKRRAAGRKKEREMKRKNEGR